MDIQNGWLYKWMLPLQVFLQLLKKATRTWLKTASRKEKKLDSISRMPNRLLVARPLFPLLNSPHMLGPVFDTRLQSFHSIFFLQ